MKHTFYKCKPNCLGCQFCEGGLGYCTTCGGFEGQLTTDCAGHKLNEKILDRVWKGFYNFKDGKWVRGSRR